jgi:phospholipase C
MRRRWIWLAMLGIFVLPGGHAGATDASPGLDRVNHVLVLMQENHSFDNYLGTLPYVPGGPLPSAREAGRTLPCQ